MTKLSSYIWYVGYLNHIVSFTCLAMLVVLCYFYVAVAVLMDLLDVLCCLTFAYNCSYFKREKYLFTILTPYKQKGISIWTWHYCRWHGERWTLGCLQWLWNGSLWRNMCWSTYHNKRRTGSVLWYLANLKYLISFWNEYLIQQISI